MLKTIAWYTGFVALILAQIGLTVGAVYVFYHFVTKFW